MRTSQGTSSLWLDSRPFADLDTLLCCICILSTLSALNACVRNAGMYAFMCVCGLVKSYRAAEAHRERDRGGERRWAEGKKGGVRLCMVREGRRELNSWVGNSRAEREEKDGWVTLLCDEVQCKDSRLFLFLPVGICSLWLEAVSCVFA